MALVLMNKGPSDWYTYRYKEVSFIDLPEKQSPKARVEGKNDRIIPNDLAFIDESMSETLSLRVV